MALALGKTVGELMAGMDSAEFTQWIEYFTTIEPFPSERSAWGHAQTARVVAAVHRGKGPAPRVEDFLIGFDAGRSAPQSAEAMTANFALFAEAAARARRTRKGR